MTAILYALGLPAYLLSVLARRQRGRAIIAQAHEKALARLAIRRGEAA